MNKQELIEKYKELENSSFDIAAIVVCQLVLKDLEQLDEPKPVKVKQFVADWYEENKDSFEEGMKNQSKCIKVPREIRPFDIGYRIVNKYGQALALRNGASIFDLPFLAEKAIEKEFGKNDPDFDIGKHSVEEVAIVNLSKFHSYFEEVE